MKLEVSDIEDLKPVIAEVVRVVLAEIEAKTAAMNDRLALSEVEAARLIGVPRYVLGDCRRRGEITGKRVGKRIFYSRRALVEFLMSDDTTKKRR